jgi:hypothetical protein
LAGFWQNVNQFCAIVSSTLFSTVESSGTGGAFVYSCSSLPVARVRL